MSSAIYEGVVRHRRYTPHAHAFHYKLAQLFLDLDELEGVFSGRWLWSRDHRNLAEFRRSDYFGDPRKPLADSVRDAVQAATGRRPLGPIKLLTHLRYAGFSFNPVSFYYCYADSTSLECILAEITNTPWRERHAYILPVRSAQQNRRALHWSFSKEFHVSPFMAMDREYEWTFTVPDDHLRVHMNVLGDSGPEFDATLVLKRREIDGAALRRVLWRYPLMTAQVMGAIHWQALRLWLKGNPVHNHPLTQQQSQPMAAGRLDRFLRGRFIETLRHLRFGQLILEDNGDRMVFGDAGHAHLEPVTVRVHHCDFYQAITLRGSVGAAEAYMDGQWTCSDLVGLVRLLVRNRDTLDGLETGVARVGGWLLRAWHSLNRNSRSGSRRNIAAHYDLGNDFFGLFLSPDLMYSSAVWKDGDTLSDASTRKLELICSKLALGPADRVIEIGSGWGGFACHAAKHYGCHVTTITISQEQFRCARARVEAAGLTDKVEVLLRDYREITGQYDKLVSIEMIEAVGAHYLEGYFERIGRLLKPGGQALIQAITIEDHRYAQALREVDFIKRYIFPGSFIPSIHAMLAAKSRTTHLALTHLEDFGESYARTLRAWRQQFMERLPQVRALGFDARFIRKWEFYFAYCEGGFLESSVGVAHLLMTKPKWEAR